MVQVVLELGLEVTEFHAGNNSTCDLGHDHGVISSDTEMSQGWVRAAIHRHLIERVEQREQAKNRDYQSSGRASGALEQG